MSFEPIEESRYLGEPVHLFLFRYAQAAAAYFGYTDAEQKILHGGQEYMPIAIDRDAIVSSGTLDKAALKVRMPRIADLAELFRAYPPSEVVNLTIFQGHANDPGQQFMAVWTGRVLGSERTETEFLLTCEPVSTSLKRTGLRRHYQYPCPHALYGQQCGRSETASTVTVAAQSVGSVSITLPAGWQGSFPQAKFVNGYVSWDAALDQPEIRTILGVSGNVLTLSGAVRNLAPGQSVAVRLGCNHLMDDCENLHDNINNFGGQPWIPLTNPIGFTNQYY